MTTPLARQVAPDFIRGVAIVLMVFGHVTYIGSTADAQSDIRDWIYTFHMPIFLIISGYFLNLNEDVADTAEKIVRRFVVPYLVFLPLYLIGLVGAQHIGIPTNNAPPISLIEFANIVFLHPIGAYWFLHSLILMAGCLAVSRMLAGFMRVRDASTLILFVLLLVIFCKYGILKPWAAGYYLIGIALARGNMPIPASLPVGLIGMAGSIFFVDTETTTLLLAGLVWCLSIISVLAALAQIGSGRVVSFVAWIGRNTLIILLCHAMFVVALKPASGLFLRADRTGIFYALTVTAVTIAGCLLTSVALDLVGASRPLFGMERVYQHWRPRKRSATDRKFALQSSIGRTQRAGWLGFTNHHSNTLRERSLASPAPITPAKRRD